MKFFDGVLMILVITIITLIIIFFTYPLFKKDLERGVDEE